MLLWILTALAVLHAWGVTQASKDWLRDNPEDDMSKSSLPAPLGQSEQGSLLGNLRSTAWGIAILSAFLAFTQ